MPVTIKDLSQRCGLSVSAISKALNNYTDISEETRAYVRKVAAEMGYFPNAQARALKTNRSYNIGVVYQDGMNYGFMHNFFISILDDFKRAVENRGYDLTFLNRGVGDGQMSYLNHCRYRGMDGALIACVDFLDPEIAELSSSDISTVSIDNLSAGSPCVMSDNRTGMRELVNYVARMGHEKIAFVHGEDGAVTQSRRMSFFDSMAALGLRVVPEYVVEGRYHSPDICKNEVEKLLNLPEPPTCILLTDDYAALGGMEAISKAGLRIPEDISVTGYDGIQFTQLMRPRLTTVRQDTASIGCEAARLLLDRIENPSQSAPLPVLVSSELITGETVLRISAEA